MVLFSFHVDYSFRRPLFSNIAEGTNAWLFSKKTWPRDPAYFQHRFSNGPVWAESLAKKLDATLLDFGIAGG